MSEHRDPSRASAAKKRAEATLEAEGRTGHASLKFEVEEIGDSPLPIVEQLDVDAVTEWLADPADDPWRGSSPGAELDLKLRRESSLVRLCGAVRAHLEHTCGRCAKDSEFVIELDLDLHLAKGIETLQSEVEMESEDMTDDTDLVFFDGKTIAVDDIVREQIFLETPMHPTCGGDKSVLDDSCELDPAHTGGDREWQDPRWAALADLKGKLPKGD